MKLLSNVTRTFLSALMGRHGHTESDRTNAEVPILFVTPLDGDRRALQEILDTTRWRMASVTSCEEGLEILRYRTVPIVLCDRDLPGLHWRQAVNTLHSVSYPVAIIVISEVSDGYLWNAVVDQGGFGVLAKPFTSVDVLQTLEFAFSDWNMKMPHSTTPTKSSGRIQT